MARNEPVRRKDHGPTAQAAWGSEPEIPNLAQGISELHLGYTRAIIQAAHNS